MIRKATSSNVLDAYLLEQLSKRASATGSALEAIEAAVAKFLQGDISPSQVNNVLDTLEAQTGLSRDEIRSTIETIMQKGNETPLDLGAALDMDELPSLPPPGTRKPLKVAPRGAPSPIPSPIPEGLGEPIPKKTVAPVGEPVPPTVDKKSPEGFRASPVSARPLVNAALQEATEYTKQLHMLQVALQEIKTSGAVTSGLNTYYGMTPEQVIAAAGKKTETSVFKATYDKIADGISNEPGQSDAGKALRKMYDTLPNLRGDIMSEAFALNGTLKQTGAASAAAAGATSFSAETEALYTGMINELKGKVGQLTQTQEEAVKKIISLTNTVGTLKGEQKSLEAANLTLTESYKKVTQALEEVTAAAAKAKTEIPKDAATAVEGTLSAAEKRAETTARAQTDAALRDQGAKRADLKLQFENAKTEAERKRIELETQKLDRELNPTLTSIAKKNLVAIVGLYGGKALGLGFTALLVWYGYHYFKSYFSTPSGESAAQDLIKKFTNANVLLRKLQFNPDGDGDDQTNEIISAYRNASSVIPNLFENQSPEDARKLFTIFDDASRETDEWIAGKPYIEDDLVTTAGFEEATQAVVQVRDLLGNIKTQVLQSEEQAIVEESASAHSGQAIHGPIGKSPEEEFVGPEQPEHQEPSGQGQVVANGQTLDFRNAPLQSPGFRSAVPRMIKKIFEQPVGQAFMDPEGRIWTGYLSRHTKTPTENDYWRALGFLYQHGIYTASQLRGFMRRNLGRNERAKYSAWREALRSYRGLEASDEINMPITAKYLNQNTNIKTSSMKKIADDFSNRYIRDALKGLNDSYSKEYFSAMKGQLNERLEPSDTRHQDLYDQHGERFVDTYRNANKKSVVLAPAMANGGLIENLYEKQKAMIGLTLRGPTGNFHNRNASLSKKLEKIANIADELGYTKISDITDEILVELVSKQK